MEGHGGPWRAMEGQSIFVQPEPGMVVRLVRVREMYPVSAQSSSVVIMVTLLHKQLNVILRKNVVSVFYY